MRRTIFALATALLLCGCGDDAPSGSGSGGGEKPAANDASPKDRSKAALQAMFDVVKAKDRPGLAKYLAYRGRDKERKWKDSSNYEASDEKSRVDASFSRIEFLLLAGAPSFDSFQSEKESEGTWLIWNVTFGKKKALFACLDIGDRIVLGDID